MDETAAVCGADIEEEEEEMLEEGDESHQLDSSVTSLNETRARLGNPMYFIFVCTLRTIRHFRIALIDCTFYQIPRNLEPNFPLSLLYLLVTTS